MAVPIAWVLMKADREWLRYVQWSFIFSAYAGSIMLLVIVLMPSLGRGAVSEYGGQYNAVAFANLTLFFGFASALTMPWRMSARPRLEMALKAFAVPLAIYALWVSETRSSWILFAVLCLVLLLGYRQWSARLKVSLVAGLIFITLAVAIFAWQSPGNRFKLIWTEVHQYQTQERDTSVGIRMQLWHASWLMLKEQPLAGVGAGNFRSELARLEQQGVVTPTVAKRFGEPHNDFLGAMVLFGLPGLLSIMALYFIPAFVFLRRLRSTDPVICVAAQIGLLFSVGYACFSITEMMFRSMRSVPIYAVTVAILYVLATPSRRHDTLVMN